MNESHVCGINKFVERDIDLLLAEELRVNAGFGRWLMDRFGIAGTLQYPATSTDVSVVEDGSEADVMATFRRVDGLMHRLFVENKIDAILMPSQLERYVRRGEGDVRRNVAAGYSVLFFTPSTYRVATVPSGVRQLSFEDAAAFLLGQQGLRSQYRASLLSKALPLGTPAERDAAVAATDPYIKSWWDRVYAMLSREFPGFFVHKTRYPRSVYFAPETLGQARYLRVDFKGHKGEVDLAFKNVSAEALRECSSHCPGLPGRIVANGKSSAIQIYGLEPFVISDGFEVIETKVKAAYRAAHKLLIFWQENKANFDRLMALTS